MTSTPPNSPTPRRGFHWIWILIALLIGLVAGDGLGYKGIPFRGPCTTKKGNCYNSQGDVVASGVYPDQCTCQGCTWQQGILPDSLRPKPDSTAPKP